MTDYDAHSSQHLQREAQLRMSDDTGESTTAAGSLLNESSMTDTTLAPRPSDDVPFDHTDNANANGARETRAAPRSHKPRSSGAFLLSDPLFDDAAPDVARRHTHRRRNAADGHRGKAASTTNTPERSHATRHSDGASRPTPDMASRTGHAPATRDFGEITSKKHNGSNGTARSSSPKESTASLDMDSAQIVNMALNLSESRRIASRRNVSQPIPPRLAPLPDSTVGGSLRQQLQQQRRISRTVSPKPDRGAMPRLGSGRVNSPLQTTFDPMGHDAVYHYHFSQSTLARAQKAKDYLELQAQQRRLLELVPALKPMSLSKVSTAASPPSSPTQSQTPGFAALEQVGPLGRPYNPLQYIRNRKVRARERKAIDGEEQGFGDVMKVADWVDEVAKWVATGQSRTPGGGALPPFTSASDNLLDSSPPSGNSRSTAVTTKPKRPRVDWVIDPADMLADLYWLEQDDHKKLVEDRNWHRVFPQDSELYRPLSRQTDASITGVVTPPILRPPEKAVTVPLIDTSTVDNKVQSEHDNILSSTRDRARQKLQDLRGIHHRHNGSIHTRDRLLGRKGSITDSSDSEVERKRARGATITSDSKDILEKQMMEMIAREARDNDFKPADDQEATGLKMRPDDITTPERNGRKDSTPSRGYSRRESRVEFSEPDDKVVRGRSRQSSPQRSGRASLEVPTFKRRLSVDSDTTAPNSPEVRPARRDNAFIPTIGMDLSPSTSQPGSPRAGSPTRNPFNKVKNIFRERSRERMAEDKEDLADLSIEPLDQVTGSPASSQSKKGTPQRMASKSPERKIIYTRTAESHKSHRSVGSIRLSRDDSGLRSLFKGPRIDSVLRSGVSKVSELLWRKDSDAQEEYSSSPSTSSDESDNEEKRGRGTDSAALSRASTRREPASHSRHGSKHFLDVMPPFIPTSGHHEKSISSEQASLVIPASSRPPSRRSSRFDLLKPPKIDIQNASPSPSPGPDNRKARDVSVSDTDSRAGSYGEGIKGADARLNAVISMPQSFAPSRGYQFPTADRDGRHWSISAQSISAGHAPVSKREIARLRALMLSSGIMARDISRRAHQPRLLIDDKTKDEADRDGNQVSYSWKDIRHFIPENQRELANQPISQLELHPTAARVLGSSIQTSAQEWQKAADVFASQTTPDLQRRVDDLRARVALDLTSMTRTAADEADEMNKDLVANQRLKVKLVVDTIEKLLQRRRRRFRWVRRAGWLAVEWLLVGFMWYVWFVVMIARIFLAAGRGVVGGVRWLLWI